MEKNEPMLQGRSECPPKSKNNPNNGTSASNTSHKVSDQRDGEDDGNLPKVNANSC